MTAAELALKLRLMVLVDDVRQRTLSAGGVFEELKRIDRLFGTELTERLQITEEDGIVYLRPREASVRLQAFGCV